MNPDDVRALASTVEKCSNTAFGLLLCEDAEQGHTGQGQDFREVETALWSYKKNPDVYDGTTVPGRVHCPAAPGIYGT